MSISIKVIKRFTKGNSSQKREAFIIDLDSEENAVFKDMNANQSNSEEFRNRLNIIHRLVLANKMKDIAIYTSDLNDKDKEKATALMTHLEDFAAMLSTLCSEDMRPSTRRSTATGILTTRFVEEAELEDGLTRCIVEVKDDDGKWRTIRFEYYE